MYPYPAMPPAQRSGTKGAKTAPRVHNERHLIVVQHGLWGSPTDVAYLHAKVAEKCGPDVRVVSCPVNEGKKSMEGIIPGSQRLVDWILERAAEMPNLEMFSFVGYSLGGILGRVAVAELLLRGFFLDGEPAGPTEDVADIVVTEEVNGDNVSVFSVGAEVAHESSSGGGDAEHAPRKGHDHDPKQYAHILKGTPKWQGPRVRAEHFVTIATPHLGARKSSEFLYTRVWNWAAERLTGQSGQEMLLLDGSGKVDSHLMVQITSDVFVDALRLFQKRALYANALNDRTVPYHSASVHLADVYELHTPYQYSQLKPAEDNPALVHPDVARQLHAKGSEGVKGTMHMDAANQAYVDALTTMHRNLSAVEWERFDVLLNARHTHGHIIVRREWINTDGAPVVAHLAKRLASVLRDSAAQSRLPASGASSASLPARELEASVARAREKALHAGGQSSLSLYTQSPLTVSASMAGPSLEGLPEEGGLVMALAGKT